MAKLSFGTVNTAIISGELDGDLDRLIETCRNRKVQMGRDLGRQLRPGDRVCCQGLRPRYINGVPAKVVQVNQTTVTIIFEEPTGRFAGKVRCPLTAIVKMAPMKKSRKQ